MSALGPLAGTVAETKRVLHVDDEPDFAALAATYLEREYERLTVETATSASEGLDRLAATDFDCIISDYDMPGQNGIDFLDTVRQEYPDLPFILFTGKGSEEVASDAISAGVTDYLQKEGGTYQYTVLANRVSNAIDHYRSQQLIKRSETRLREIVDALPHLLYVVDENGTYLLANETLAEFHDTTVEAIEGTAVTDVLEDSLAEQFRDDMHDVLDSGDKKRLSEVAIPDANGETHVFEPRLLPYDLSGTATQAVLGIAVDVTERQRHASELERARERMQLALEHTDSVIFEIDLDTRAVTRHGSFEQFFELSEAAVPTLDAYRENVVHPHDRESFQRFYRQLIRGDRRSGQFEFRTNPEHGTVRWIQATVSRNTDADTGRRHVIGLAHDITALKEHERELETTTRRFQAVLDTVEAAIFIKDTDGRYQLVNQECRRLLGMDPDEEIVGMTDHDLLPDEIAGRFRAADKQVIETEETVEIEEEIPARDGTRVNRTLKSPFYDEDGTLTGICAVSTDITDRKEHERDLQRERDRLDEFASVVSHDLRTPLSVAEGRLELAREECDTEHLDAIETAIDRMDRITEDVLWLAREGRDVGSLNAVVLQDAVESAWTLMADDTGDAELAFADEALSGATIEADSSRLRQLLENLLRNAIEHGGEDVTVTVGAIADGFYVEDDGPGIPEDRREDVFVAGYSTSERGTGFGLSIVEQIADAHGWDVHVTDGSAGGTRFEITDTGLAR